MAVPPPGRGSRVSAVADGRAIVRLDRQHVRDAAREAVDADLDGKVRPLRDERVGGVEHRLERLPGDDVLRPRVAGRRFFHRAGRVDEDRDGGAKPFLDFGLVGCGRFRIVGWLRASARARAATGIAGHCGHEQSANSELGRQLETRPQTRGPRVHVRQGIM